MVDREIVNLTHHQNVTMAILTTMEENLSVQQALANILFYNGKDKPLRYFLLDIETGYNACPEGVRKAFIRGVVGKLRDTARDAVHGQQKATLDQLKNVLKGYFVLKKTYANTSRRFKVFC